MKLQRECVPCLLKMVDQVSRRVDPEKKDEIVRMGKTVMESRYNEAMTPPWLATQVLETFSRHTGTRDFYLQAKQEEMAEAKKVFEKIRPFYGNAFQDCVDLAVLGNNLDFFRSAAEIEESFRNGCGKHPDYFYNHSAELKDKIEEGRYKKAIVLSDNAGEVHFDGPLLRWLSGRGIETLYAVKEKPFINDLTRADFENPDDFIANVRVVSTGTGALLDLGDLSDSFSEAFDSCDLIVSKGQANFECLGELTVPKDVFFLLKAKCACISRELGAPVGKYIALLQKSGERASSGGGSSVS